MATPGASPTARAAPEQRLGIPLVDVLEEVLGLDGPQAHRLPVGQFVGQALEQDFDLPHHGEYPLPDGFGAPCFPVQHILVPPEPEQQDEVLPVRVGMDACPRQHFPPPPRVSPPFTSRFASR